MALRKVLVVAEGPSEIGDLDALAGYRRTKRTREGYIPAMLRQVLGDELEITAQRVSRIGRWGKKPKLEGEGERAAQAVLIAETQGCELLVFVRDVDKEHGAKRSTVERRRKLREMQAQIDAGFAAAASTDVVTVKGTPCRMIEAWALGDRRALQAVGVEEENLEEVPNDPEDIWGAEKDPMSGYPKCVLRRVLGREPAADDFEDIARESRPDELAKTCPDSFRPFLAELRRSTAAKRQR